MPENVTPRDRAWAAVVITALRDGADRLTLDSVLEQAGLAGGQRETVRRTMNAATALGILDHDPGSPTWVVADGVAEAMHEAAEAAREQAWEDLQASWYE